MSTFQKNKPSLSSSRESNVGTRIHKVLAQSGYGSRREIEKAISDQKVKVNNEIATLGQPVLNSDKITFNGKIVRLKE
jgi:23S rRNA pseudouridine2605 synthase